MNSKNHSNEDSNLNETADNTLEISPFSNSDYLVRRLSDDVTKNAYKRRRTNSIVLEWLQNNDDIYSTTEWYCLNSGISTDIVSMYTNDNLMWEKRSYSYALGEETRKMHNRFFPRNLKNKNQENSVGSVFKRAFILPCTLLSMPLALLQMKMHYLTFFRNEKVIVGTSLYKIDGKEWRSDLNRLDYNDVVAYQILKDDKLQNSKNDRQNLYELNLVIKNGTRIHLLSEFSIKSMLHRYNQLTYVLNKPLWDPYEII